MSTSERFDVEQQRAALAGLAKTPDFLNTIEGESFLRQLKIQLIPAVLASASSWGAGSDWLTEADVLHTAIVRLLERDGRVARYASEAEAEPWAYLSRCLLGWMRREIGTRALSLEQLETAPGGFADREDRRSDVVVLTPLETVVSRCFEVLAAHTPGHLLVYLEPLLRWLARNPPQRLSYERREWLAAATVFPAFTERQLRAVMSISWGSRPKRKETSIMGQFLLHPDFRPSDSPSHARALIRYKQAMNDGPGEAFVMLRAVG